MRIYRKKYKFIALAFFLSLLHAAFPHTHEVTFTKAQVITGKTNNDVSNKILSVFSFNLGAGHLENYNRVPGQHINQPGIYKLLLQNYIQVSPCCEVHDYSSSISSYQTYPGFHPDLILRGPPELH